MAQMASYNSAIASGGAGMGGAGAKVFSIANFSGAGLDEAGLFKILGDEKDTFSPMANVTGVAEMLGGARGGAESLLKRMFDLFKSKEEAWDAATFISANKDAIQGQDWRGQEAQSRAQYPEGRPIDPNHGAFQGTQSVPSIQGSFPQGYQHPFNHYANNGGGGGGGDNGGGGGGGSNHALAFSTVTPSALAMMAAGMTGGQNIPTRELGGLAPTATPGGGIGGMGIGAGAGVAR